MSGALTQSGEHEPGDEKPEEQPPVAPQIADLSDDVTKGAKYPSVYGQDYLDALDKEKDLLVSPDTEFPKAAKLLKDNPAQLLKGLSPYWDFYKRSFPGEPNRTVLENALIKFEAGLE